MSAIPRAAPRRGFSLREFFVFRPWGGVPRAENSLPLELRPPRPGRRVKTLPGSKSQKRVSGRVSGGSLWGSLRGSWPTPPKRVKTSLLETLRVKNHLFFDSGDSRPGPSETPPETLPETLFGLFEPGRVLTPLTCRGGGNPRAMCG